MKETAAQNGSKRLKRPKRLKTAQNGPNGWEVGGPGMGQLSLPWWCALSARCASHAASHDFSR